MGPNLANKGLENPGNKRENWSCRGQRTRTEFLRMGILSRGQLLNDKGLEMTRFDHD